MNRAVTYFAYPYLTDPITSVVIHETACNFIVSGGRRMDFHAL